MERQSIIEKAKILYTVSNYAEYDVFNADEIELFCRVLSDCVQKQGRGKI